MVDRVGQQLGHYRLLRFLGQGAFADVYLGEHQYLERLAAIKVLRLRMEKDTQEQFRLEARTIANLQHPHIVSVHDFGLDDQIPYLVMEYTPGGTLLSRHPKGTRLPFEQIVSYVKQIASALDYAHEQRVIHRDVKPANLLLNARGEVVLSDFGLAVVQRTRESLSTQEPVGTPLYMAPEQLRHHPCAASDQYALGVMVYEWLCGEPPFRGQLYALLAQHLSEPPPSLCQRLPDLPSAVEEAVFVALAKEPGQRFATVQDFALALSEACLITQPFSLRVAADQQRRDQDTPSAPAMPPVLLVAQRTTSEQCLLPPRPAPQQQTVSKVGKGTLAHSNRQRFLRRVRAFWIDGVLEHSLHGAALIALGLQEQRDALANPWHLVLQHPGIAPRSFPVGTAITEVYDAANGELLILGAPGAGKTTLLLELARNLLDRAEQEEQQPMPVVFPLSSWAARQQPLGEWMIEELISKYQVPRQLARTWVETGQILPLLDGLDEVAIESRTRCIETINTYQQEHAFLPLVVASRSADYLAQTARVKLTSAVTIQSLTQQQVEEYLARGGEALRALRVALHQDAALRELAETPLMLSILTLTYHGMPVEELLQGGLAPTRQQVFERYTERILQRRSARRSYTSEQTLRWLGWLARQLTQHNQTEFFIERIQPDWLFGQQSRWLAFRALLAISIGLIVLVAALPGSSANYSLSCGIVAGLIAGWKKREIKPTESISWSWKSLYQRAKSSWILRIIVAVGVAGGLMFGLGMGLIVGQSRLAPVTSMGVDRPWFDVSTNPIFFGALTALGLMLPNGLLFGLFAGWSSEMLDKSYLIKPNQGIRSSARHGGLVGLLGTLIVGLFYTFFTMIYAPSFRESVAMMQLSQTDLYGSPLSIAYSALNMGLLYGLIIGLVKGGFACIQHALLRLLFWRTGCMPWNYSRFLDYAAEQILLRKVGGGYIFIHRLLLEYFASLDTPPTPDAARAKEEGH